jgi:RHS repeat-associated protein
MSDGRFAQLRGHKAYNYQGVTMPGTINVGPNTVGERRVFAYDNAGRITSDNQQGWIANYQYDGVGNRTKVVYPYNANYNTGFYVAYDYDGLDRMAHVRENGAASGLGVLATYSYDDLSRETGIIYGNGVTRTIPTYTDASQPQTMAIGFAGGANNVGYNFAYNQAGELSTAASSNDGYDWTGSYGVTRNYAPPAANGRDQYGVVGANNYSYAKNGGIASDGSWLFSYDAEDRLVCAQVPGSGLTQCPADNPVGTVLAGSQITYRYNGLGKLVEQLNHALPVGARKILTQYSGLSDELLVEHGDANVGYVPVRKFVNGNRPDAPLVEYDSPDGGQTFARQWLVADRQGSTVATANDQGQASAVLSYGPFGEPNTITGPRLRYTGQWLDPNTQLVYLRARWYSPWMGRFMNTDPIGQAGGVNVYGYTENDPVNGLDPSGLATVFIRGNFDSWFGQVDSYASGFKGPAGSGPNAVFSWWEGDRAAAYLNSRPSGEVNTVIGWSYGGDTAAKLAASGNVRINKLFTIDPVGLFPADGPTVRVNTEFWFNIHTKVDPENMYPTDHVASTGNQYPDQPYADANYDTNLHHKDFTALMQARTDDGLPSAEDYATGTSPTVPTGPK